MVKVVFVKKNGTLKNSSIKINNLDMLYKKCLFSSNNHFESRNIWSLDNKSFYTIYSKDKGKSGKENKYELPPPIDSTLYFGTMVILKHSQKLIDINSLQDLTLDEWEKVYVKLFGGFENIEEEEDESSEEYVDPENLTKEGYDKTDGFIVDDEDSISLDSDSNETEDEYVTENDEYESNGEYEEDNEDDEYEEDNDDDEEDEEHNGDDEEDEEDEDDDEEDDEDDDYEDEEKDYLSYESYSDESDEE